MFKWCALYRIHVHACIHNIHSYIYICETHTHIHTHLRRGLIWCSTRIPFRVQKLLSLHILRCGCYDPDVLSFLSFKQQLIMNGCVLHSQVIQCFTVSDHHSDQVFSERSLSAPRLTQTKNHIWLRGLDTPLHCILQGRSESVRIVEHSSSFLFLQTVGVLHGRGAVVDDSPAEGCGVETLIFHLQHQPTFEVGKDLPGQGGWVTWR